MKKYLKKLHSVILFILFLLFNTTLSFSQEKIDRPVYQLENENLQTIPHSYFQYLEGVDHTIPFKELKFGEVCFSTDLGDLRLDDPLKFD